MDAYSNPWALAQLAPSDQLVALVPMLVAADPSYLYSSSSSPCNVHLGCLFPEARVHASRARDRASFVLLCSSPLVVGLVGLVGLAHRGCVLRCCARERTWVARNDASALREVADYIADDSLHPVRNEGDAATAEFDCAPVSKAEFVSVGEGTSDLVPDSVCLRASKGQWTVLQDLKAARAGIQSSAQAHDLYRGLSCVNLCHDWVPVDREDDMARSDLADLQAADVRDVRSGPEDLDMINSHSVSAHAHCDREYLFVVRCDWCEGVG